MATLLYHWNFTGANDLSLNEEINDSESSLVAKVKGRGTISSSTFSRGNDGITLNNDDGENGGYYIDLEGLNTIGFGGNLSIEMAVQNHARDYKAVYFLSVGEESGTNQAFINARYNGLQNKMFFGVRTDSTTGVSYTERKISEENSTVIDDSDEHHYIFSFNYDSSGSSVKINIDGDNKGENDADLEKALTTDARSTNFIGTRKVEGSGVTYLNGVVKYLKIYRNSMSDSQASSIYDSYDTSPYLSNVSNGTNGEKFTRRHDDVESYFTNNSSVTSFSITGNQLGLSNGSENYKVFKFTHGDTFTISDNYNYIPIKGLNQFAILNYGTKYFRITQTSVASNENAKYKCELSEGNADNFSEVCSNQGFGDTYTNGNITILFGGAEFNVSNEICFHEDTIINTDQGEVKIKDIKSFHTIEGHEIIYLVKSDIKHKQLVLIKKNAFGRELPSRDTILTRNHHIFVNNKFTQAHRIVDNKNVFIVDNKNSDVYNIILLNKKFIKVNNIFMDVLGIDDLYLKILKQKLKNGENYHEAAFSKETMVNLELCKIKNF